MSEKLVNDSDIETEHAAVEPGAEQHEQPGEVVAKTPEQVPEVAEIRETVDKAAESAVAADIEIDTPKNSGNLPPANKELKAQTLNQTLKKTRQHLSKPQKVFSKIIHQPQVDAISNATGKTIARPIGLFFGGLFALIGSTVYIFLSHHYHFAYKYIAFSLFFIGGFIIGLLIEFIGRLLTRKKL